MNDIVWRVIKRAHIPATKEPVRRENVTVPDTYAESYIDQTAMSVLW